MLELGKKNSFDDLTYQYKNTNSFEISFNDFDTSRSNSTGRLNPDFRKISPPISLY